MNSRHYTGLQSGFANEFATLHFYPTADEFTALHVIHYA